MPEGEEEAGDGKLENGFIESRGIEIIEEVEAGFLVSAEVFEPVLFEQPALVMGAGGPTGDVASGNIFDLLAELVRDLLAGHAIAEHEVELVASGFGEATDFAAGTAFRGGGTDPGFSTPGNSVNSVGEPFSYGKGVDAGLFSRS